MFLLMLTAIYGIIGELSNPGAILPGVVGAMALILALYMAAILPVNVAGLALMLWRSCCLSWNVFTPTHGVLTFGGIFAFFLGALMLFDRAGPTSSVVARRHPPRHGGHGAVFIFAVGTGIRAQRLPVRSGRETMLGKIVPARARIDSSDGKVFVEGEYWNAVSDAPSSHVHRSR